MTLVETLVAMAIASVVLTALALSLWTLRRSVSGLTARDGADRPVREAVQELGASWVQAADLLPDEPALQLSPEMNATAARPRCQWYAPHPARRAQGEWARMELHVEAAGAGGRLLWIWTPLPGEEAAWPPETNVVARAVRAIRLEAHDGVRWRNDWPPPDAGPGAPRLPLRLRIEVEPLERAGAGGHRAQTAIPAAVTVTSQVLRASSAAR
jgi:hypothetical protein